MQVAFAVFMALALTESTWAECPGTKFDKFDPVTNTCYGITVRQPWSPSLCDMYGAQMLAPANVLNGSAVKGLLLQIPPPVRNNPVTIGLYRDADSTILRTPPNGDVYTGPTFWDSDEPKAPTPGKKMCGFMRVRAPKNGEWYLDDCDVNYWNACQVPKAGVTTSFPPNTCTPPFGNFISKLYGNACYLSGAQWSTFEPTTKARAVNNCKALGGMVFGSDLGLSDSSIILENNGIYWTDAYPSGRAWKYMRKNRTVPRSPPSPRARPRRGCLAVSYQGITDEYPDGKFNWFKTKCGKKFNYVCRVSAIDKI